MGVRAVLIVVWQRKEGTQNTIAKVQYDMLRTLGKKPQGSGIHTRRPVVARLPWCMCACSVRACATPANLHTLCVPSTRSATHPTSKTMVETLDPVSDTATTIAYNDSEDDSGTNDGGGNGYGRRMSCALLSDEMMSTWLWFPNRPRGG